jgi:hypothetical protein
MKRWPLPERIELNKPVELAAVVVAVIRFKPPAAAGRPVAAMELESDLAGKQETLWAGRARRRVLVAAEVAPAAPNRIHPLVRISMAARPIAVSVALVRVRSKSIQEIDNGYDVAARRRVTYGGRS